MLASKPIAAVCCQLSLLVALCVAATDLCNAQDAQSQIELARENAVKALEKDQQLAPDTKAALQDLVRALGEQPKPPPPPERSAFEKFLDRLSPYGDFFLRYEGHFHLDDQEDSNGMQVRVRLGANYEITDEVIVGTRLTMGPPRDAQSSTITLGDVFHKLDFSIDRAFLGYSPDWAKGTSATLGKFAHPFATNPVFGELVWDGDVQPDGAV